MLRRQRQDAPASATPLLSDLADGFKWGGFFGRQSQRVAARPLAREQRPPDHLQIVAHHPVAPIAQIARQPHVQTPIQSIMFPTDRVERTPGKALTAPLVDLTDNAYGQPVSQIRACRL